jgi:hypothetical protein
MFQMPGTYIAYIYTYTYFTYVGRELNEVILNIILQANSLRIVYMVDAGGSLSQEAVAGLKVNSN